MIKLIGRAQKKSGYLNTAPTIKKEFENLYFGHELYCGGHLIQAGIAHYRSTGKENLFYEKNKNFKINYEKKEFKAIPYFLWANRGRSKMSIWFLSS